MAKCNLAPELRDEYLRHPKWWEHSAEELDKCRPIFNNFLFYDRAKNYYDPDNDIPIKPGTRKIYHCSACGEVFPLDKREREPMFIMKHGDPLNCPQCGVSVQIQSLGRVRDGNKLHQTLPVSYINLTDTGAVCIDSGIAFYDFNRERDIDYADMNVEFISKKRCYIEQGTVMGWKRPLGFELWRELHGVGDWEETVNITEPFSINRLYGFDGYGNVFGTEKLRNSQLKYSAIEKYYQDYHNIDITDETALVRLFPQYLAEYALNNRIEMAVKLGMSEAVGEWLRDGNKNSKLINWKANDPAGFVRMSKEDAKEFYKNPSLGFLRWFSEMKRAGAVKNIAEARSIESKVGRMPPEAAGLGMKYGVRPIVLATRMKDGTTLGLWKDYVTMGEKLGLDFSRQDVLFPKDLRKRHDDLAKTMKIKADEEKNKAYRERKEKLVRKFGFTMDGLTVIVPESIEDIVQEGKTLQICVGAYAHRHVEGKTTILFLRHERRPERSFLCIEVNNHGDIVQIHGFKNDEYKNAIAPRVRYAKWLNEWQNWYAAGSHRDRNGKPIINEKRKSA